MADPIVTSKLKFGTTEYILKDAFARGKIEEIEAAISGSIVFIGITSTALTDGATTNPIVINGNNVTAKNGNLAIYQNGEFLYVAPSGETAHWVECGDLSVLGALAYKDSASGSYTPAGTVSQPTFSGSELTSTGKFTPQGTVAIDVGSGTANYTPAGTVTQPSFTGSEMTSTGSYTPAGSVSQPSFTGETMTATGNFTPAGSVSQPTFEGSELTSTGSYTPAGGVAIEVGSGTANYTPAGTVAAPTISVASAGATTTVNSITDVGTLPELSTSYDSSNECLTISFSQGTLPTKGSDTTVKTGDASYSASAPAFTGTGVDLEAAFTGTAATLSVTGTPAGTVSQPSFTGTQGSVSVSGTPEGTVSQPSFTGTAATLSVAGTPTGTVSQPSFTGTGVELVAELTGTEGDISVTGTPAGTVSQPTFTGTAGTVTVS